MRETRTLEIQMTLPRFRSTEQTPFTEEDLDTISRRCGEIMSDDTDGNYGVEAVMKEWTLEDGYLVYRPGELAAIRIGRGSIEDETSWWVDVEDHLSPCHGFASSGWRYQAHFPGIFTADWVNWIYRQWLA